MVIRLLTMVCFFNIHSLKTRYYYYKHNISQETISYRFIFIMEQTKALTYFLQFHPKTLLIVTLL